MNTLQWTSSGRWFRGSCFHIIASCQKDSGAILETKQEVSGWLSRLLQRVKVDTLCIQKHLRYWIRVTAKLVLADCTGVFALYWSGLDVSLFSMPKPAHWLSQGNFHHAHLWYLALWKLVHQMNMESYMSTGRRASTFTMTWSLGPKFLTPFCDCHSSGLHLFAFGLSVYACFLLDRLESSV